MSEHEERPFAYALLTALQLTALGLAALVMMNMLLEPTQSPVPVCPAAEVAP